ncbi:MAG TPA: hypothetical protein PKD54_10905, partial [Pirellulaceae bacterium]|nr:hypothetical protein [Pirellulaceae bacterium]
IPPTCLTAHLTACLATRALCEKVCVYKNDRNQEGSTRQHTLQQHFDISGLDILQSEKGSFLSDKTDFINFFID